MAFDPELPFRVYCVRNGTTGTGAREIVASFARYLEAEVFVHCELLHYADRGTDTGRFWGMNSEGGQVHFWIESAQRTASVRDAM